MNEFKYFKMLLFIVVILMGCRKYSGTVPIALFEEEDQELADAIYRNDALDVQQLIEKGANVNATVTSRETTILSWATKFRNKEILTLLLKAGADVNKQNLHGSSAFTRMIGSNCVLTPMNNISQEKDLEILDLFLKYGAEIEQTRKNQMGGVIAANSPLALAVRCSLEKVRFLAEKGADLNKMVSDSVPLDLVFPLNEGDIAYNISIATYLIIEKKADYRLIKPIRTGKIKAVDFFNDCGYENLRIEAGCTALRDYVSSQELKSDVK